MRSVQKMTVKHLPAALLAGMLCATSVWAETVTWDGGDQTWGQPDADSWTPTYDSGDDVQFLGAGAGTVTVVGGGVTPGNMLVNSSADYTITGGSIGGTGGIAKAGSGLLVLFATNTFTGDISISAGDIIVGSPANGNYVAALGAFNGTYHVYDGDISIASGSALRFRCGRDQLLNGVISGGGNLLKRGPSTLAILQTNNTYTGKTYVSPQASGQTAYLRVMSLNSVNTDVGLGTVHLPSSSLGAPTTEANGTIVIGQNIRGRGVLEYVGPGETTDRKLDFIFNASMDHKLNASGTGPLKFVGAVAMRGVGGDLVLEGTNFGEIVGSIPENGVTGIEKTGGGTWTLSGRNNYTGGTTVNAGTLIANEADACGIGWVTINGGRLVANADSCLSNNTVTVSGGVLEVAAVDCLNDAAALTINSGTVHLNSGVKEAVGSLYFGAALQAEGSWGSPSSTAQFKSTNFTGTGKLYAGVEIPPSSTILIIQ